MNSNEFSEGVRVMPAYITGGAAVGIKTARKAKSLGRIDEKQLSDIARDRLDIDIAPDEICGIFDAMALALRSGYDVYVTDRCRFFGCLDRSRTQLEVVAQTMGKFRDSLADLDFTLVSGGQTVSERTLQSRAAKRRRSHDDEVTPDTQVTCPNCGHRFRVGKRIAA